ncbi:MAG: glutamate racemase [Candidatus Brocadia sp.]|jgi:glutamate racemase (EC 5.1.1.3)|uniref:Glutamate racemase n=1 Tax=Candidatus Brocadia fulgida TaxID=380242 RepID=A0A0M2UVP1_9BACT|nr:MAG: glutamate racemase [Candidatus Brocadia fulgida]MCC6325711.1 glutamate racemase [Candidatus Brocadia sp.]MCE7911417.1 glutamate racemase [Candidatus Brocadia sp. AMX3]MBV6519834.1 Glutamate racemase 2 [Candidatus Brocadia fulgida]MDG5995393.1 glutamate racemase [Candidatus Brocadia sp.]
MKNPGTPSPIGVFDSGIGGISVLAELIKALPWEKFVYFADTLHSPYGTKPEEAVRSLSLKVTEFLAGMGIKSLVVACNTATSAAINEIRRMCPFPVIGMEPAIKPAVELGSAGKILVMATPLTLKSRKFNELVHHYQHRAEIVPVPCVGLVEIIERNPSCSQEVEAYLSHLFSSVSAEDISAIVLGCTHYVLIKKEIAHVVGDKITIIDGNSGTARRLRTVLQNARLLNTVNAEKSPIPVMAQVTFYISGIEREERLAQCKQLLRKEGIFCEEPVS